MDYLGGKTDLTGFIIEYNHESMPWFPRFYLGREVPVYRFTVDKPDSVRSAEISAPGKIRPNYVFFFGNDDLGKRVSGMQKLLGRELIHDKTIQPSFMDDILHRLNPRHNRNLISHIYKISAKDTVK